MPGYNSKSQKRSKTQSKNGGRHRKRTLKNVRRRKSRKVMKVMKGGGDNFFYETLKNQLEADNTMTEFLERYNKHKGKHVTTFQEFKTDYYRTGTIITIHEIKNLLQLEQGETSELAKSISNLQTRSNDIVRLGAPFRNDDLRHPLTSSGFR
jgi:hypothetical protein